MYNQNKNLWNYSDRAFRFQIGVTGIHISLSCSCCEIFAHQSCLLPTYAEHGGAAFRKQGPLQPALVRLPPAYYQDGQIVIAAWEWDWWAGSTSPLHHFYSAMTQIQNLSSLSPTSLFTSLFLCTFSWTFCLTEGLALAFSHLHVF